MTTQEKIEVIRQKCIEANPSVVNGSIGVLDNKKGYIEQKKTTRSIGLADVLLAMSRTVEASCYGMCPMHDCEYGRFIFQDENAGSFMGDEAIWWFKKPLEDQPEQTIDFFLDVLFPVEWREVSEGNDKSDLMPGVIGKYGNF